jgi:hypothetical protein
MKLLKKINILLACVGLLLTILVVQDSYAKYLTEASGTTNISIARWKILVNGQDIRNNSSISNVITPKFIENEHINNEIIAPGSKGYFDLVIDCEAADVSFSYDISTSVNVNSSVKDLKATSYSIDGGEVQELNDTNIISGQVLEKDNINQIEIRVYIVWDDSDENIMDNEADTEATASGIPAKMDVNLSLKQIAEQIQQ